MVGILFIIVIRISAVIVRGRVCMHALYIRFSKSLGARELVSSVRTKTEKETELFSEFKESTLRSFCSCCRVWRVKEGTGTGTRWV